MSPTLVSPVSRRASCSSRSSHAPSGHSSQPAQRPDGIHPSQRSHHPLATLRLIGRQIRQGVQPLLEGLRDETKSKSPSSSSPSPRQRTRINLSPTSEQHRLFARSAKQVGLPLTTFVLEAALAAVREKRILPPATEQALSAVRVELRRIGVNLNQLVARCNRLQRVRHGDLTAASETLRKLENRILQWVEDGEGDTPKAGDDHQEPLP